ncbi:MAG: glutamate-ammonia-ligase adenylyltransferase [Nitrosomonadales bacterium]|nr:glutamate-ammonia-ligase adenylyltransferase [Nitrosomonadales bacterium]
MKDVSSRNLRVLKVLLAIFVLGAVYWFGLRSDPKVVQLNRAIQNTGSPALRDYPYSFSVVRLEGGTAVMGTPRSPEVPVYRMISAIYPYLSGKSPDNPDFIAAEKELAQVQSEARQIILGQPGVTSVKWELDRNWLIANRIQLN